MFKPGSKYTRNSIWQIYHPDQGDKPRGGVWDTGYAREKDDLLIFMNLGNKGATGHDYANKIDEETGFLTWFGKSKSHAGQPTIKKIISGELTPHFFARKAVREEFTYLGVGKVIDFDDPRTSKNPSDSIKLQILINDVREVVNETNMADEKDKSKTDETYSFSLEKHLEDFIIENWTKLPFGKDYDFHEKQHQTGVGPCDILALRKDKKEYLILELKKGRPSDKVVGQLARYMTAIRNKFNLEVKGCVIAAQDHRNLTYAIASLPNSEFYKFNVEFDLEKIKIN